ncbi:MAG: nuclear transport factor 2 family protein [Chloroflexota bacterium]
MTNLTIATMSKAIYGKDAKDLRVTAIEHTPQGARAALESFYYAFNQKSLSVFEAVWAPDPLIQLNNPLGGVQRGYIPIRELYRRIFEGPAHVWVEFSDIVEYLDNNIAVFAGKENGEFSLDDVTVTLAIRTTRIFKYLGKDLGWRQIHHHGSIDDAALLKQYQEAVKGKSN